MGDMKIECCDVVKIDSVEVLKIERDWRKDRMCPCFEEDRRCDGED